MTTPEETSEIREQEGTTAPSSGKVKVVALLVGAPTVAPLFWLLYHVARRLDLLPETSLGPEDAGIDPPAALWALWAFAIAFVLAVIPLYFAFKIWLHPILKNLRRVPFIAAFWCYISPYYIYRPLRDSDMRGLLLMISILVTYFMVKKVLVWWLEMPELKDSGLSIDTKRALLRLYCFFLWVAFIVFSDSLTEAFGYDADEFLFSFIISCISLLVSLALALICYYVGKRALNLNQR